MGWVKNTIKALRCHIFSYVYSDYSISDFGQLDIAVFSLLKENYINVLSDLPITLFLKIALFLCLLPTHY